MKRARTLPLPMDARPHQPSPNECDKCHRTVHIMDRQFQLSEAESDDPDGRHRAEVRVDPIGL